MTLKLPRAATAERIAVAQEGAGGPAQAAKHVPAIENAGIPGYTYTVERTTNVVPGATWTPMWTTNLPTSPPVDVWQYYDSSPLSPLGFYRLRSP